MNPTFHRPISINLTPTMSSLGPHGPNQFNISMQYRRDGHTQNYLGVYVPEKLQPALLKGNVRGMHLDTLEVNCVASMCLENFPNYVVLGITTSDGDERADVPMQLLYARRWRNLLGLVACGMGGLILFSPFAWAGALPLVIGTHLLRTAKQIPHKPFKVYKEHS